MRRLVEHQAVTVELDSDGRGEVDGVVDCIDCMLGWVRGPVATLAPLTDIAPDFRGRLIPGSLGFMLFDHRGAPIGLRGVARAICEGAALEFVVIDGIQLAERRTASRVALQTPVRAASLDDRGVAVAAVETVTTNLSMGGALLVRRPGLGEGPRWQIELSLPNNPTPVRCTAMLARQTPSQLAVAFADIQDTDRIRLAAVLADHQRRTPPAGWSVTRSTEFGP